jgi:two-component system KDP operon response regulator KdpE
LVDFDLLMHDSRALRVLVVEDEPAIRRFLRAGLSVQGYEVVEAELGRAAIDAAHAGAADLILLDLGLPDIDGLEVIKCIRASGSTLPIIVLTSRTQESAKVSALDEGADDYLTKPFGVEELLARIRAAQRHRLQQRAEPPVFHSGDLKVDLVRRVVTVRGKEERFSPREYEVLRLLVAHADKVLTHNYMLSEIWGDGTDVQYLRIYIRALRQKIERDPERPQHIVTETGVSYRLRSLNDLLLDAHAGDEARQIGGSQITSG